MSLRRQDLVGKRFTKLVVVSEGFVKNSTRFWQCLCDCGNYCYVRTGDLNRRQRSCGCAKKQFISQKKIAEHTRKGTYSEEAIYNRIYGTYRYTAKAKDHEFKLSFEECLVLFKAPCFYCGAPPKHKIHYNNNLINHTYNGIDRVDNQKGYLSDNVVSCCKPCNMSKGTQTQTEFLARVEQIYFLAMQRRRV